MGSTSSRVMKKFMSPVSEQIYGENSETDKKQVRFATPIVYYRRGSMYFDEDGDLAHEFYVEVLPTEAGTKATMRRINDSSLIPQGEVKHPFPRLHTDFPVIIYQG